MPRRTHSRSKRVKITNVLRARADHIRTREQRGPLAQLAASILGARRTIRRSLVNRLDREVS